MKSKIIVLLSAVMLMTATGAFAQSRIDKAISDLIENGYARQTKALQEMDSMGITTGRCQVYRLDIPQANSYLLDNVLKAFDKEQDNAYYQLMENADSPHRQSTALTYGNNGEYVIIGDDSDRNYRVMCFIDPEQNDYRTGYAVEWANNDGQIEGRIACTYGSKPSKKKSLGRLESLGDLEDLDLSKLGEILPEAIKTIKVIGKDDLKKLGNLEGLKDLGDYLGVLTGEIELNGEETTDDVQWLTQFNHYRNAFLRAVERNSSTAASYATNILKLCKKSDKANLSANEKKLCIKNIKEMRKKTKDTFLQGLLDEACDQLK